MGKILLWHLFVLSVVFLFLGYTVSSHAQGCYIIRHYTNENGLPANGLKGIELDKKTGFLWVGTQGGLARFDGVDFKNFSSGKGATVSRTNLIARNREGAIYFEDDHFSVYRIRGSQPEFIMTDTVYYPFFQNERWQSLYRSVGRLKKTLKNQQRASFLPNWAVFPDGTADSNNFSFVHFGHGYQYIATKDTLLDFPGISKVLKVGPDVYFVDSAERLWQYSDSLQKLQYVEVRGIPDRNEERSQRSQFIWTPGMDEPLFISGRGIWTLRGKGITLSLSPLCQDCCPLNANISSAQVWKEQGIIFLGSHISGLYAIKTRSLQSVRSDIATEAGKVEYAQVEIEPGTIYTASGFSYSAEGKLLPGRPRIQFASYGIYRDQRGDCWFNHDDTIIHYYPKTHRYSRIAVNDGASKMIFLEARGRMYVFSDQAFAEITGEQYRLLHKLPFLPHDPKNWLNPDAVVEMSPGTFAIATEKVVLLHTGKKIRLDTISIPGVNVKTRALLKYRDYLLIGTYGQGIYIYKNGTVKKMPLDKNDYLSYAHCFMPDSKGFCWISTNRGLLKVSLEALTEAYENNLDEIYYHYFGKEDGIYNTELNGGCQPCALQLSTGLFSFPSMDGVVLLDPLKPHTPPPSGPVFVEAIYADSMAYRPGDSMLRALPNRLRNIRITVALSQFSKPENVYFSYKLEPYNDSWEVQDITRNNTLLFGGLKPGNYKLYLRVRNGFAPDAFNTTVLTFRILVPWYQRWWFYALCFAGLIALIWGIVKWRTSWILKRKRELQQLVTIQTRDIEQQSKRLEKQLYQLQAQQMRLEEDNRVKARLIGIISHDMISPIKFVGYLSKKLRDSFPASDDTYQSADLITTMAQNLESLSVNMLNWIRFHHESLTMRKEKFNLYGLIRESVDIASTLAKEKGLLFHIDIPENTLVFHYRQIIGVMIYNLAMNAVKHTAAGEIRIACNHAADHLSLSVTDTGAGMPPEMLELLNNREIIVSRYAAGDAKKYQFGYVIIKDLLRLSSGNMEVTSILHQGTSVTLSWPVEDEPGSNLSEQVRQHTKSNIANE